MVGTAFITTNSAFAMFNDEPPESSAHASTIPHISEMPDTQGRMPGAPNYGNPMSDDMI